MLIFTIRVNTGISTFCINLSNCLPIQMQSSSLYAVLMFRFYAVLMFRQGMIVLVL